MTLTVRLDATLESALERYSGDLGVTKTLVVQEALVEYLAKRGPPRERAVEVSENYRAFERAGLIGCVEGDGRPATKEVVRERLRQRVQRDRS